MEDNLKQIMESTLLTDEVKTALQESWMKKCSEYQAQVKAELREEFANLYKKDKSELVEAMDKFLTTEVKKFARSTADEIMRLNQERMKLNRAIKEVRLNYRNKLVEHKAVCENFVLTKLKEELLPMAQDHRSIQNQKIKLAKEIVEARKAAQESLNEQSENLKKYFMSKLGEEKKKITMEAHALAEEKITIAKKLREERKSLRESQIARMKKLETFILDHMVKEFKEFGADKRALVEAKVKLVKESKQQLEEAKKAFIKRASSTIEKTMLESMKREFTELKQDIKEARENRFGRRIFEAVAEEYMSSYLSEGSEVKNLSEQVLGLKKALSEKDNAIKESKQILDQLSRKAQISEERAKRSKIMNDLLTPLGREKRAFMEELLETVKTDNLKDAFRKYLPTVLNESKTDSKPAGRTVPSPNGGISPSGKSVLNEGKTNTSASNHKVFTGNRTDILTESKINTNLANEDQAEIDYISKMAGLKRVK